MTRIKYFCLQVLPGDLPVRLSMGCYLVDGRTTVTVFDW